MAGRNSGLTARRHFPSNGFSAYTVRTSSIRCAWNSSKRGLFRSSARFWTSPGGISRTRTKVSSPESSPGAGIDRAPQHIHAISQATADDLVAGGVQRITVAPLGVDAVPRSETGGSRAHRRAYALPDVFLLYVGAINVRKNFSFLAAAVDALGETRAPGSRGTDSRGRTGSLGMPFKRFATSGSFQTGVLPRSTPALPPWSFLLFSKDSAYLCWKRWRRARPFIASDIAVFREIGGDVPAYFNPADLNSLQEDTLCGYWATDKQMSKEKSHFSIVWLGPVHGRRRRVLWAGIRMA